MYAIIEDGSRQYRVSVGDRVRLDHREIAIGSSLEINKVLLVSNGAELKVGLPLVAGAKVVGEVIALPAEKTVAQSFRRRKNSRRLRGHTQPFVEIQIKEIIA